VLARVWIGVLVLASCAHTPRPDAYGRIAPPRGFVLVNAVSERPVSALGRAKPELELDAVEQDRIPKLVTQGRSELLALRDGERARLYGDVRGTSGWSVDTCVVLEVFTENGKLYSTAVAGHAPGVLASKQRLDNVGRRSASFEPGEVDLNSKIPHDEPFFIQATVLAHGVLAKVSDIYVIFEKRWQPPTTDMREQ
jgi:hypothetical protein